MNPAIALAIARALFHFVWEGAAVAAMLAVALWAARGASARVRYALACAAMLAMVMAFGVTLAWFWPHTRSLPAQAVAVRTVVPVPVDWVRPEGAPVTSHAVSWFNWVAPVWMAGVVLFSLRSLVSWLAALRLRRRSVAAAAEEWQAKLGRLAERARVSRPVKLLESYLTDIPVVIGFLKPAILVPASLFTGFSPQHLEAILLHELAHIRRHDYLVNLLQSLAEDVLFYHPAVWWVSSVIRAEREHCCDDEVVALQGDGRGFAQALAALEERRWSAYEVALGPGVAANGGHLMYRIQRLLNMRANGSRFVGAPLFSSSLVVAAAVLAVSISHAQNAPAPPAPARPPAAAPAPAPMATPAAPNLPAPVATPAEPQPAANPEAALKKELETPYKKWLNAEVFWIITQQERKQFQELKTDDERDKFIEQFWLKRDPTPGTPENEYKEEFYRRVAYANETFGSKIPGWKTDRGMIYIKYGAPDEIEKGGGTTTTYPFEKWRYRYIEGIGNDVVIEFVDPAGNGEYHMTGDPAEKDKLLYVPGAGLTLVEQFGLADKSDRFTRTDGTRLGTGTMPLPDQFQRLQAFAALQAPPKPAVPPEDAIEAVFIEGTRRTPHDTLLALIHTHQGGKLDTATLDQSLKALRDTGRFDDVTARYARGKVGWVVTFTVVERPACSFDALTRSGTCQIPLAGQRPPVPRVDDRVLLK